MSQMTSMNKKCGKCGLDTWYKGTNRSTIYCGSSAAKAAKCTAKTKGADKPNTTKKMGEDRNFDQDEGTHGKVAKGSNNMVRK